jgi:hypothetical protein
LDSKELNDVLDQTDFWIPQFYAGRIPRSKDELIAITDQQEISNQIVQVRNIGKPFFAGLAVFSQAMLFTENGEPLAVIGNLDPAAPVFIRGLDLVESRPFSVRSEGPLSETASEWRYVFQAREECVLGRIALQPGQYLIINQPSGEGLRYISRFIREKAGDHFLGVCLFRLPVKGDFTTLTAQEIRRGLLDEYNESGRIVINSIICNSNKKEIDLIIINKSEIRSVFCDDAFEISLDVPPGSIRNIDRGSFDSVESFNRSSISHSAFNDVRCSVDRADVIRLRARYLAPGDIKRVRLSIRGAIPQIRKARIRILSDSGRVRGEIVSIEPDSGGRK